MILLRVFIPFALGYLLSYLLRVVNSVLAPSLIEELGLTASDLGLLTSANLFAFALFQLPLGVLLDRYGPRKTEAVLLLIAAAGTALFAMAGSMALLMLGRAMMGLGTSACLMAAFTAYALWLPKEKLPTINAYQMVAGGAGALLGTTPVEFLEEIVGWRGVFWAAAAFAFAMAVIIYVVVPRRNERPPATQTWGDAVLGIRDVYTNSFFWRFAPACVFSQATFIGVQSLWLGPWFNDVLEYSTRETADALFTIALTMVIGNLCVAWVAGFLGRRGITAVAIAVSGMTVFLIVQGLIAAELAPKSVYSWMAWAFVGAYGNVGYAALTQKFPTELTGRVLTGLNVLVFFGAFSIQWGVGVIIDLWEPLADGRFNPAGYQAAFIVITVIQAAALAWFFLFRPRPAPGNPT